MKQDTGKPQLSLVPAVALVAIARAMEHGNTKNDRGDFYKAPKELATLTLDASLRHLAAASDALNLAGGSPEAMLVADPDSGLPHLYHAIASLAITIEVLNAPTPKEKRYRGPRAKGPGTRGANRNRAKARNQRPA